jgi:parallel beta-helix repeat protein
VSINDSKFYNTGQVYVYSSVSVQVTDTEIHNNYGDSALYIWTKESASATIDNVTIDGVPDGRGIYADSANSIRISGSQVRNCSNSGDGGGIYLKGTGNKEISDVTIENCTNSGDGGGIFIESIGYKEISGVTIENCTSNGHGGGIYISNSSISDDNQFSNVTIENCTAGSDGGGIYIYVGRNVTVSNTTIKNTKARDNGGGLCYRVNSGKLDITGSLFENCTANFYGAIFVNFSGNEITDTVFINCTSKNNYKINEASRFAFIRNSTFTHDNNLVDLGSPSGGEPGSFFGYSGGNFKNCTFNNLKGNFAGENYLFTRYSTYPDTNTGSVSGGFLGSGDWILRNCTFNFNSGSAGLMALMSTAGATPDYLLMDVCAINNNGGQQPLIWLNGNTPAGSFQFRANNYYNGTLLNNLTAITGLGTGVFRSTGSAMPVIVP